jgi:hypothetical protein
MTGSALGLRVRSKVAAIEGDGTPDLLNLILQLAQILNKFRPHALKGKIP